MSGGTGLLRSRNTRVLFCHGPQRTLVAGFSDHDIAGELCRYREITRREAIAPAFEAWEEVVPTADEEDSIALERARRAADAHCSRST